MFRKSGIHKKNHLAVQLLLFAAIAPNLTPATCAFTIFAFAAYRAQEYYRATHGELPVSNERKVVHIDEKDMLSSDSPYGSKPAGSLIDDKKYEVFFGRKPGFEDIFKFLNIERSPLSHSAIVIKMEDKYLIVGRQSPCGTINNPGLFTSLIEHGIRTQPCNEKYYGLFKSASFNVTVQYGVMFTGGEIKDAIREAQEKICDDQSCTMILSNCYSFSIYVLTALMSKLDKRSRYDNTIHGDDFVNLGLEIQEAARDHAGIGIVTNAKVLAAIKHAQEIAKEHYMGSYHKLLRTKST